MRTLEELLDLLKVSNAPNVTLHRITGGRSADKKEARKQMIENLKEPFVATAGPIDVGITEAESIVLRKAGAIDKS